jgi:hypothetical protein
MGRRLSFIALGHLSRERFAQGGGVGRHASHEASSDDVTDTR